ncbi:TetR/AcrR family transcriptional regulator [Streptomyces fuscichromogenes]|uniref:TetR/AcrR family transcriptional regulator n=1 Tax=Streptomyces fuscichromogenes TaxID=1324013 RepID=UPI00380A58DF
MPRIRAATVAEHRDRTMSCLLDAFEEALAEQDFADVTLAGVAERAGIARNTVYNYAKDKQALLVAVVERAMSAVLTDLDARTAADASAEQQLCAVVDRLLTDLSGGTPSLLVLQALQGTTHPWTRQAIPSADRLAVRMEDVLRAGVNAGEFRTIEDIPLTVAMLAGVVEAGVLALARGGRSLEGVSREVNELVLRAVRV